MKKKNILFTQELTFIIGIILFILNFILLFSSNGSMFFVICNYIAFLISIITGIINMIINKKERKVFTRVSLIISLLIVFISTTFIIKNSIGDNVSTCDNVMSCDEEVDSNGLLTCYYCKDMYDEKCIEEVKCKPDSK